MKIRNYLGLLAILLFATACPSDDENAPISVELRDRGEQSIDDDALLREFFQTHFYNFEDFENPLPGFDNKIVFDTIAGENADRQSIWERNIETGELTAITYERFDAINTLYILTVREGVGPPATFADSTFVTYSGRNLYGETFDNAATPLWFNLAATIDGFARGMTGARGGSGFSLNDDGTTSFENDYGIGAIFIPSGLGYFAAPPNNNIELYASLVFEFEIYDRKITDHDGDGILSINEDINNNQFFFDDEDNTDDDSVNNFRDPDDDNDGVTTKLEIVLATETIVNNAGEEEEVQVFESFLDTDGDGVQDHLDDDDDGDGRLTLDEINVNFNTGVITYPDTDGDGTPDYLDSDS